MIRWPTEAGRAVARLFRAIQDLDVYVEDQDDESFYLRLLQTASGGELAIKRVIGLGGREAVLSAAAEYRDSRKALFIIDGDFALLRSERAPPIPRLHRLSCYCVENILIKSHAVAAITAEELACEDADGDVRFGFDQWQRDMLALVPVAARYAVLNLVDPTRATISSGLGAVVENDEFSLPVLSASKIQRLIISLDRNIEAVIGAVERDRMVNEVIDHISGWQSALDAVSGKAFLLPFIHFRLKQVSGSKISKSSLRYRLATKLRHDDVQLLKDALSSAA